MLVLDVLQIVQDVCLSVCEGLGAASVPETAVVAGAADGQSGSSVVVGKDSNVSAGKGLLLTRGATLYRIWSIWCSRIT